MASLISKFPRSFDSTIVSRGRVYFISGRARAVSDSPHEFRARVRGSADYDVQLVIDGNELGVWCGCPFLTGNLVVCKHVVAAIMLAEARGALILGALVENIHVIDDDSADTPTTKPKTVASHPPLVVSPLSTPNARSRPVDPLDWRQHLASLSRIAGKTEPAPAADREIGYVVDVGSSQMGALTIDVLARERRKDGEWGARKPRRVATRDIPALPDADDRRLLAALLGAAPESQHGYNYAGYAAAETASRYKLLPSLAQWLVPEMAATGRFLVRAPSGPADLTPLRRDDGNPWRFVLDVVAADSNKRYAVAGTLTRGAARRPLSEPLLVSVGFVFDRDSVGRIDEAGASSWIELLRRTGPLVVPAAEMDDFVAAASELPGADLHLPKTLQLPEVAAVPRPRLDIQSPSRYSNRLRVAMSFDYDGTIVDEHSLSRVAFDRAGRRLLARDVAAESNAAERLANLGLVWEQSLARPRRRELRPRKLPSVVRSLLDEGWYVEAEGRLYRQPGSVRVAVTSGVDWFDLSAKVDYGGPSTRLPDLLTALKRGESMVQLDDGSFGMLPEAWLEKYAGIASFGTANGDTLRFNRSQVGLLDALLAEQPDANVDRVFEKARTELQHFERIEPIDAPPGFVGVLRPYQRDGLGWLMFLERFGFGGCLADDMGLGKTVQVLALLEMRRTNRRGRSKSRRPSLVVVPKSLVFNWKLEALRFTPELRVLDHTGAGRHDTAADLRSSDVVLTTYGTLRRDADLLRKIRFDYVILDEAQAIKNASTDAAKAARVLRGDHKLAMSGTPIENHIGELWSLFEFLNPGFLGSASAFRSLANASPTASTESRDAIARAVRPFILRRTKDRVARDLPDKTEQTLFCELETEQRRHYDELAAHYRASLFERVDRDGIKKAKMHVLEALLRLRQAACHTGLIDPARVSDPSAKLDLLLSHIDEIVDEGHKVIVFSQFTSFLAIVRSRLDAAEVAYEYLDGRTRDRAARVERFQSDKDCRLFLISLKAGGLGLNLTEAEYVFLLDPWWNPAVEAQAIDRAHRIGQTRSVFAYRIIAKDTVEEKVLELQASKRDLADAIVREDAGVLARLTADDLQLLLA